MGMFSISAVSPTLPVEALTGNAEGGRSAAEIAVRRLLPGVDAAFARTSTWSEGGEADELVVATYGDTVVFLGEPPAEPQRPTGFGTYYYGFETTSLSMQVEVDAPDRQRNIVVTSGVVEFEDGDPLPFEAVVDPVNDQHAWGIAAVEWMFGYDPSGSGAGERFEASGQPVHVFTVA